MERAETVTASYKMSSMVSALIYKPSGKHKQDDNKHLQKINFNLQVGHNGLNVP
jgi:hypothetical protein